MKKFKEIYKKVSNVKCGKPLHYSDSVAGHARLGLKWDWLLNVLWQWHNPERQSLARWGFASTRGG